MSGLAARPRPNVTTLTPRGGVAAVPTTPGRRFVRLHANDNVVVAVVSLPTGTELEGEGVKVARAVPMGHKIATRAIAKDANFRAALALALAAASLIAQLALVFLKLP